MKTVLPTGNSHIDMEVINKCAKDPERFVANCERDYMSQIQSVVNEIIYNGARVVMLAGPSSSGKTTTAHKISKCFSERGIKAPVVSLDDFFLGKAHYQRLPNGLLDMESINTLDLKLINQVFAQLTKTGEADFPLFDFENSCRKEEVNHISLGENDVLVVEGLHALNPLLTESIDAKDVYKVYVSTRTQFMYKGEEVLTPKDNRLIRRIVRDHNFRNRAPKKTLDDWVNVLDGEKKYIYEFRDNADFKIDSALNYEGCIFHHYILPLVDELKGDPTYGGKIRQIVEILEAFDDIDFSYIPEDSLLREFIGK